MQFIPSKIVFHVQDKSIPLRLVFSSLRATLVDARGRSYILSWPEVKHIIYAYRYIIQRKFKLKLFTLSMMSVAHVECLLNQLFKTHPRLIAINQIRERKVEEKKVIEKIIEEKPKEEGKKEKSADEILKELLKLKERS